MTADPQGGLSIAWNAIDLPRTLTTGSGTGTASTQRAYLADGTLAQVGDGTTTRLYLGDMVFDKASNGTVTLESAGWEGGRLLPGSGLDKVLYTVADHLGSVRVVKDGSGVIRQRFDYYPYGTVSYVWTNSSTTDSSEKRYRFGGKEIAGSSLTDLAGIGASPGAPYLDFGARLYSPRTATWMSPDPLMENYYGVSPFVYCLGRPLICVDFNGTYVVANGFDSIVAIKSMFSDEELQYISFDEKGMLNNNLINEYTGHSILLTTLASLSKSTVGYYLSISDVAGGEAFYDIGNNPENPQNYYYGITMMPGQLDNPSPDSNVHVYSASFLDPRRRAKNVAHELLGHAFFYELSLKDETINPNHTSILIPEEYYDEEFGMVLTKNIVVKTNTELEEHIKRVEDAALINFDFINNLK